MATDEVRHCFVSGANLISDYPAALSGVSANSYIQIHITKRSSTLAEIYITAITNQSVPYTCVGKLAGSTFHWELLALKSELSGVKFVSFQVSSGVSVTLNLGNTFRGILFCSSVYNVSAGVFNVVTNNSGGVSASAIAGGSEITFNTTVNNKITVSSSNYVVCTLMILLSEASVAS